MDGKCVLWTLAKAELQHQARRDLRGSGVLQAVRKDNSTNQSLVGCGLPVFQAQTGGVIHHVLMHAHFSVSKTI